MGDNLFLISRADIFSIYPKIFNELIAQDEAERQKSGGRVTKEINLPSDYDFKLKVYFRLLDQQRRLNEAEERGQPPEKLDTLREVELWDPLHDWELIATPPSIIIKKKCFTDDPMNYLDTEFGVWQLEDIAKAGMLLRKPPLPCTFHNEHEMRRVYSLIYDVFRYKTVLHQALINAKFFTVYEHIIPDVNRVWLILFDLHMRHFLMRDPEETKKKNILYKEADLTEVDEKLWSHRIKLAAALSRLRIENGALTLSHLLPIHLQDEKVAIAAANPIVSGWINPFKFSKKEDALMYLRERGFTETPITANGKYEDLSLNQFKWDRVCPFYMQCLPTNRGLLAQTPFIKDFMFILQDRAFSIGPAYFSRLLDYFTINGDVVQTHVSSPRSTAYLASLFLTNARFRNFLAFGAGARVEEYRDFMATLGVNNVRVYAENFTSLSLKSQLFERVVGVFATPPNSYSGVTDPIDLICSRGGDLTMLEVLTESEVSDSGKRRVAEVLMEQKNTIRLSLSRPQIQFLLYETHSVVSSENEDMLARAVEDVNRAAQQKHYQVVRDMVRQEALSAAQEGFAMSPSTPTSARRRTKRSSIDVPPIKFKSSDSEDVPSSDSEAEGRDTGKSRVSSKKSICTASEEEFLCTYDVPPTDIFEIVDLPDICLNRDQCLNLEEHGSYLALARRKEITRFDSKYLIKMAETRGLFGDSKPKTGRAKIQKKVEKKEVEILEKLAGKQLKRKKSDISVLINRLSTPTLSFLNHSYLQRCSSAENKFLLYDPIRCRCLRHMTHHHDLFSRDGSELCSQARKRARDWWQQTTRFVVKLRRIQRDVHEVRRKKPNLYKPIREKRLNPLRLPRVVEPDEMAQLKPKRSLFDREAYPLSVNQLEMDCRMMSPISYIQQCEEDPNGLRIPHMTQYIKYNPIYYYSHSC
ncbi:Ubiquitin-protein ligase E3A, N-terminal zinc-binding domain [Sergentomyia squamirostris]